MREQKIALMLLLLSTIFCFFKMETVIKATPIEFSETFLGSKGNHNTDDHFDLEEGWKAIFEFKLFDLGGYAILRDEDNNIIQEKMPSYDETRYDPNSNLPIEAYLSFQFSSEDLAPEKIQIKTSFLDGNKVLFEKTYWLGYWWFGYHRKYADLTIDLKEEGVLDYLRDGQFVSIVIAPEAFCFVENDFSIEWVNLSLKADPIPEPATILLTGIGLGLVYGIVRLKRTITYIND